MLWRLRANYVIRTPDRKKKSCVCHVNMLKQYFGHGKLNVPTVFPVTCVSPVVSPSYSSVEDGPCEPTVPVPCVRLDNSKVLERLDVHLSYLYEPARGDICNLIRCYALLFGDTPTQTTVLQHDVDVGEHSPIKQHAYRVNPVKRAVMQNQVAYLMENGFAVPSSSLWSSPSLLVPKSEQTPRFCNDYRKVNQPLPSQTHFLFHGWMIV